MTGEPLNIVHVTPGMQAGFGGPPQVIAALAQAMARSGNRVKVVSAQWGPAFGSPVPLDPSLVEMVATSGRLWKYPRLWLVKGFRQMLRKACVDADIIHVDGCWLGTSNDAAVIAKERNIPRIVSPHGELSKVFLKRSAWKKAIARRLHANRNLHAASCMHALTPAEAADMRDFGLRNPVAVIPNGVDMKTFGHLPPRQAASDRWPQLQDKKVIVFLSRIHPIKGIHPLVQGWCQLPSRRDPWHLVIAGPDELGLQAQLQAMTREAKCADSVTFTGPVYGQDKLTLLGGADLFVLPSLMEGFSMAILEAMASALPAILTPGCNFGEAIEVGAGLLSQPNDESLMQTLSLAMNLSDDQRRAMGQRGRALVEEKYSWDHIAAQMTDVYRWLAGQTATVPACVQT